MKKEIKINETIKIISYCIFAALIIINIFFLFLTFITLSLTVYDNFYYWGVLRGALCLGLILGILISFDK